MVNVRKLFVALVLGAVSFMTADASAAQGSKWWESDRFQKSLALTPDQIANLDRIFQETSPTLRAQKRALDKLEDELSQMVLEAKVGAPEFEAFVARVEAARAELGKTRTLMLYRMRCVLSLEQHKKMKSLHDERERERHGDRDNQPRRQDRN
jgi:Spy/CpxP family protein refolding chaperone